MSKIAKCPICGKDPETYSLDGKIFHCQCCEHRVEATDAVKSWNQYAAAMGLAKAWSAKNKLSDEEMFKGPITEERLEQFKELNKRIDVSLAHVLVVFK